MTDIDFLIKSVLKDTNVILIKRVEGLSEENGVYVFGDTFFEIRNTRYFGPINTKTFTSKAIVIWMSLSQEQANWARFGSLLTHTRNEI